MTNEEAWILLNHIFYLKAGMCKKLISTFDSDPQAIFNTDKKNLEEMIGEEPAGALFRLDKNKYLDSVLSNMETFNIRAITPEAEEYPSLLKEIYDPPLTLFAKGKKMDPFFCGFAVVGSRYPTEYGKKTAFDFSRTLSRNGISIVSGLARGIDSYAHKGALEGGSLTVAVLGCGLDFIYPPENKELSRTICSAGTVVSEFAPLVKPLPLHFPFRNRIISGLSKGILVVEAREKSGALITASCGIDQNRLIYAVPGKINDKNSAGCNKLIQAGAKLVINENDIFEDFNILGSAFSENRSFIELSLSPEEKKIFEHISYDPIHFDALNEKLVNVSPQQISFTILNFEMKKIIKRLPGDNFVRA